MIISTLCDYYSVLERRGETLSPAYSRVNITHALVLSADGTPVEIICKKRREGKSEICESVIMPRRTEKPAVEANIVEHRAAYLFGAEGDNLEITAKSQKQHEAFRQATLDFFEGLDDPLCRAFVLFAGNWSPAEAKTDAMLLGCAADLKTARLAICLDGRLDVYLHDLECVKRRWEERYAQMSAAEGTLSAQCPIFGEELPVARIHNKIKGLKGGQSSGCSLVSFNSDAENSYGREQSYNSAISVKAMEEYTFALNYLLQNREHRTYLGDMTVVHFALAGDETEYVGAVNSIFDRDDEKLSPEDTERSLKAVWLNVKAGSKTEFGVVADDDTEYCMFGLVPNVSRIAVRFSYRNTFGTLRNNVLRYHEDFAVDALPYAPPLWRIVTSLMSVQKNEKVLSNMASDLLGAVISGGQIPQDIFLAALARVKTDRKVTDVIAGLLKACLIRKTTKKYKEKITMALNESNHDASYLCGRLFAVLEKIQLEASGGSLNKTIKDTYFSSAAATPAVIFARLIQLSQKHLAKIENEGRAIYFNKLMTEIIDDMDVFPKTLSLEEQAEFILGYYQQVKVFYTKKTDDKEEK